MTVIIPNNQRETNKNKILSPPHMLAGHITDIKIQSTRQGPVCHDRYYPQ